MESASHFRGMILRCPRICPYKVNVFVLRRMSLLYTNMAHKQQDAAPQQLQGSHSQPKASALAVAVDPIRVNSAQPVTLNATLAKRRGTIAHSASTSRLLT